MSSSHLPFIRLRPAAVALLISLASLLMAQGAAADWDGLPGSSQASWRDYFRNFNRFEDDDQPGAAEPSITVVDANTWRIRKPAGRKRAEMSRAKGWEPAEGETYYLKWRLSVSSPQPITSGFAVFQWKTDDGGTPNSSKQNYPFNLRYEGSQLTFSSYGPGEPNWRAGASINDRRTTVWQGPLAPDEEIDIVIGVKVSRDEANGALELWIDGEQQMLSNGLTRLAHRTNDGVVVYPKWGAYGGTSLDISTEVSGLKIDQVRPGGGQADGSTADADTTVEPATPTASTPTSTPPRSDFLTDDSDAAADDTLADDSDAVADDTSQVLAIVGQGSGKCVGVSGGGKVDRAPLILWDCVNGAGQGWVKQGDALLNPNSGKCLDVDGASRSDGATIQLWRCNGGVAQRWVSRADGALINPNSGKCLDALGAGTANGTLLQLYSCHGQGAAPNQSWAIR